MLKSYLKIAVRNLLKHKAYSFINVFGLAIGMTAFLLILHYVLFELSYDRFHANHQNIYRVKTDYVRGGDLIFDAADNFPGVGPALKRELSEVADFTRLYNAGAKFNCVVTYQDAPAGPVKFREKKLFFADASLFTLFSFRLLKGDAKSALAEPNRIVLSESAALRYFGMEEPIGKRLQLNDETGHEEVCLVSGIFKEVPANSHLKFDFVISYKTLHGRQGGVERYENDWGGRDNFLTYILLAPGADPKAVAAKLPVLIDKYKPDITAVNERGERLRRHTFVMQPLADIHLHSHFSNEAEINGDSKTVYSLMMIAAFVLVIAWINYLNLATAKATERAKEIGVRKVTGATPKQLIGQFLLESSFINGIAVLAALALIELLLPAFEMIVEKPLNNMLWSESWSWPGLVGLFAIGALLSGLYPAFIISSFQPTSILKGRISGVSGGKALNKMLVIFQFAASVALITGTMTIYRQLEFMRNHDLGFNPDQILVIENPARIIHGHETRPEQFRMFKSALLQYPSIKSMTRSNMIPGQQFMGGMMISMKRTENPDEFRSFHYLMVDRDFLPVYEMELLAGRNFRPEEKGVSSDSASIILNESAAIQLGFENAASAIGQEVYLGGQQMQVIGVIRDYHHLGLQHSINPMMLTLHLDEDPEIFSVKVSAANLGAAIAQIREQWDKSFPGNPFDFFFLDDSFAAQYKAEQRFGQVFMLFAALAILIACLGLLGLAAYAAERRTKEIGIRKVLGASVTSVASLLSKQFTKLVLMANFIAWPIAYFAINAWLQNFAYRIGIGWWMFALAGGMALLIALATVSMQAIKAALVNPVEALRYE
ncbi:MAG: ABC transporter permease [bacterium]